MHRKITVKALTLVFFLFSIVSFASDNDKTKEEKAHGLKRQKSTEKKK